MKGVDNEKHKHYIVTQSQSLSQSNYDALHTSVSFISKFSYYNLYP